MKELRKFLCILALFSLVFLPLSAEEKFYRVSETQLTKIEQELKSSKEELNSSNQVIERQSQELMKLSKQYQKSEKSNKFKTKLLTISITVNIVFIGGTIIILNNR